MPCSPSLLSLQSNTVCAQVPLHNLRPLALRAVVHSVSIDRTLPSPVLLAVCALDAYTLGMCLRPISVRVHEPLGRGARKKDQMVSARHDKRCVQLHHRACGETLETPTPGDFFFHINTAKPGQQTWMYNKDEDWEDILELWDSQNLLIHPTIPDRVLTICANNTPNWILRSSMASSACKGSRSPEGHSKTTEKTTELQKFRTSSDTVRIGDRTLDILLIRSLQVSQPALHRPSHHSKDLIHHRGSLPILPIWMHPNPNHTLSPRSLKP
ncbi:hypothetical protein B0H17DRAFT_1144458 [Mycena rosella]|uniref:Uncharacterized protein n=1 Tax=Mycena rosella TaxID=1033263 RepID=A0AAD7CT39_MYCRO|nr:hypothetical protein B0H17DRAFT_1144458 [Mycena rosella]